MGIKEGTRSDEHWVLYTTDELLNSTSETNNRTQVNKIEKKTDFFKKMEYIGVPGWSVG